MTSNIKSIENSTAADEKENRNYLGVVRFSNDACQGGKFFEKILKFFIFMFFTQVVIPPENRKK